MENTQRLYGQNMLFLNVPADGTCSYDWTLNGAVYGNRHDSNVTAYSL